MLLSISLRWKAYELKSIHIKQLDKADNYDTATHLQQRVTSIMRFARWSEIAFDKALWTIPAEREPIEGVRYSNRGSKMRTVHLVPLSQVNKP